MKEKAGWAAPSVAFGPGALFVTFLAGVVVKLLLANPEATSEGLLPVPLATRAADSAAGLDFLENNAADATDGAVGAALGDTEEPTVFLGTRRQTTCSTGSTCPFPRVLRSQQHFGGSPEEGPGQ